MKTRNEASREIKKILNANGIKSKISGKRIFIFVNLESEASPEIISKIKSLETITHHGDSMNDTAWSEGFYIQIRHNFERKSA